MTTVENKLRVYHFAQVPSKAFHVEVRNEIEAKKIIDVLAQQHLFLFEQKIIPDYSNVIGVEMYSDDIDGEGTAGWEDYHNEAEGMDWDEYERTYLMGEVPQNMMANTNAKQEGEKS